MKQVKVVHKGCESGILLTTKKLNLFALKTLEPKREKKRNRKDGRTKKILQKQIFNGKNKSHKIINIMCYLHLSIWQNTNLMQPNN